MVVFFALFRLIRTIFFSLREDSLKLFDSTSSGLKISDAKEVLSRVKLTWLQTELTLILISDCGCKVQMKNFRKGAVE